MIANLILAAEVQNTCQDTLNATSTNPQQSQHPTSGTLNNYVPKNPPIIINPEGLGIHKCAGCKQPITAADQKYPNNMLFKRIGIYGKWLVMQNRWLNNSYNMYFHLNLSCLRKHDATVELKDLTMNDEFFSKLDRTQMEILQGKGFLCHIAAKKS